MKPWRPYCFICHSGEIFVPRNSKKLRDAAMETTLIIERLIACQR